jgi:hypothetical protein
LNYIQYTLFNDQAANAVSLDALDTIEQLKSVAGSLKLCDNPKLKKRGYRKINFLRHDYVMLYKLVADTAYVNAIYHQLQDYENTFAKTLG